MTIRQLTERFARCQSTAIFLAGILFLPLRSAHPADEVAVDALPPNLGHSLRQLVAWHRVQPGNLPAAERRTRLAKELPARVSHVQTNADATRAVVDVTLDGSLPLAAVRGNLTNLGAEAFAEYDAHRAGSLLSVRLPLDQAEAAARTPGVYSISLAHRAWKHVGKVTSQGAQVLKTATVNRSLGFDGTGITVGVISDSFDANQQVRGYDSSTHAAADVRNGDLPGPGNPFGHPLPVKVYHEAFPGDDYRTDEGRAMLQIVHDLAPGAQLVFQRAGNTATEFANNVTSLRLQTLNSCDVIVDDFGFPEEPFFSDGPAALAAENAVTNLLLPGKPVVYVSSAGNEGDVAYRADFAPVSYQRAANGEGVGNLKISQVPQKLTAGGFHNFNPKTGKVTLAQKAKLYGNAEISFQWDDPFIPGLVTADYNLLVFDADGNYLSTLSGKDDNIALGKAVELVDLPLGDGNHSITYQFAITRTAAGTGEAKHLRYVVDGGDPVIKFVGYNHATTFGHNAGPHVIGVAAYAYDKLAHPESFSSLGPATIYFDAKGDRLATPEVRQQPAVAAVDGVNTSFFPQGPLKFDDGRPATDSDGDGFPNFFGTSAAAPHVAAIAALLLQAGGGPGSLTSAQVLTLLQSTALPHDLDSNFVSATLSPDDSSTVTLSATGDESAAASEDKNGFHLAFDGSADQFLSKLVLDLGSTGLKFDPSVDLGYAFTVGTKIGLQATDVTATLDSTNTTLTLSFVPGAFTAGKSLNFGIDRDLVSSSTDGNAVNLLADASVKVRTKSADGSKGKAQGALATRTGTGYGPAVGFGLVDARAAVQSLRANPPAQTKASGFTSGNLLFTSSANRVIETTPDGTIVRVIPVPSPTTAQGVAVGAPQESVVDTNGNLAVLNGINQTFLTTINVRTGAVTHVTVPNWSLSRNLIENQRSGGEIVATGHYVFANYGQTDPYNPLGLLLRFDLTDGSVQAFGDRTSDVPNLQKNYVSLSIGPDGLLYALGTALETTIGGSRVDVYDPNTLGLVRTQNLYLLSPTFPLIAGALRFTVGPSGEFYVLSSIPNYGTPLYKFSPGGLRIATLNLPNGSATSLDSLNSLRTNAQGAILVGAVTPKLVDPSFLTVKQLDIFGSVVPGTGETLTAAFIP